MVLVRKVFFWYPIEEKVDECGIDEGTVVLKRVYVVYEFVETFLKKEQSRKEPRKILILKVRGILDGKNFENLTILSMISLTENEVSRINVSSRYLL